MAVTIDMLRSRLRRISPLGWLLTVNAAVFVGLRLAVAVGNLTGSGPDASRIVSEVMLPASWTALAHRPWTLLTYMVSHYDVWHILMNLLWLYFFGAIMLQVNSGRRLVTLYLAGGLAGGVAFMLMHGHTFWLTGASSSALAIVTAVMILAPDYRVNLLFFGPARMLWVGVVALVLIGVASGTSGAGQLAAHLGGMAAGALMALAWKYRRRSAARKAHAPKSEPELPQMPDTELLDMLLDKVRRSGYGSLTERERNELFRISNRLKTD